MWKRNDQAEIQIFKWILLPDANGIEYFKCSFLLHIAKLSLIFSLEALTI